MPTKFDKREYRKIDAALMETRTAEDGGKIVEDGAYEELIERGGFFAELVERQRLDTAG